MSAAGGVYSQADVAVSAPEAADSSSDRQVKVANNAPPAEYFARGKWFLLKGLFSVVPRFIKRPLPVHLGE
jgi:hypothetical protein